MCEADGGWILSAGTGIGVERETGTGTGTGTVLGVLTLGGVEWVDSVRWGKVGTDTVAERGGERWGERGIGVGRGGEREAERGGGEGRRTGIVIQVERGVLIKAAEMGSDIQESMA